MGKYSFQWMEKTFVQVLENFFLIDSDYDKL